MYCKVQIKYAPNHSTFIQHIPQSMEQKPYNIIKTSTIINIPESMEISSKGPKHAYRVTSEYPN